MKIAIIQHLFVGERRLGRTLALTCLALTLGAGSAGARGVAYLLQAKKPMAVEYKAACGMVYSAADAKKYHYICPMDHKPLIKIVSGKAGQQKHK